MFTCSGHTALSLGQIRPLMKIYPYKASAVEHLTDARYFAAEQACWLGFSAPLPQDEQASSVYARLREMMSWIEGPEAVLELPQSLTAEQAEQVVLTSGLYNLQWPVSREAFEPPVLPPNAAWWPFWEVQTFEEKTLRKELEEYSAFAKYLVVRYSGPKEDSVLSSLAKVLQNLPVILELDWTTKLLKEVLDHWDLAGLQFRGSEEESPGVKSFEELDALLTMLKGEG